MKLSSNIIIEKTRDGSIVLDMTKGQFFKLNSTGKHILELIKNDMPLEKVIERLNDSYENFSEVEATDFIEEMISKGVIIESKTSS